MDDDQRLQADYAGMGLTIGPHPMALRRDDLALRGVLRASDLPQARDGRRVRVAGMVITRQRPGTAKGFVFLTLEDDTGAVNVIVWPDHLERYRKEVLGGNLLTVYGTWQRDTDTGGQVMNLLAKRIVDHSHLLGGLTTRSRDFR